MQPTGPPGPDDAADPSAPSVWAPPESGTGSVARREIATPVRSEVGEAVGPRLPVPLRPMTAGDILDGAVAVVKARPRVVFAMVAVLVIPYNVIVAYLQRDFLGGAGLEEIFSNPSLGINAADSGTGGGAVLASLLLGPLTLSLAGVGMGYLVAGWYAGEDPDLGDVLGRLWRRSAVGVGAFVIVHVAEGLAAMALFLPALAVMAMAVATSPVVGAENLGPFASFRRSWELAGRRFFPVLGLALLTGLVVSIVGQVLLLVPTTAALFLGDLGWVVLALGGSLAGLLTTALQAATSTLIYLDLRVRTEGLDLEMAAADRFDVPA